MEIYQEEVLKLKCKGKKENETPPLKTILELSDNIRVRICVRETQK